MIVFWSFDFHKFPSKFLCIVQNLTRKSKSYAPEDDILEVEILSIDIPITCFLNKNQN